MRLPVLRVRQKDRIDLVWRNLFPAAIDYVFEPSIHEEVAICISATEVAAAKPSIDETRGVCVGVVEISGRNGCTSDPDFADGPSCSVPSAVADDPEFDSCGQSDRRRLVSSVAG